MGSDERRTSDRTPAERSADHGAIARLAEELLPALIARLGASGLGEIELREGDWKVRLRRPAAAAGFGRRLADRGGRAVGPGRSADASLARLDVDLGTAGDGQDPFRAAATSPAVGYYQPRSDVRPGSRVRHGDPIASIDVLGIPQEVVSPADGIVGASMVEPGDAVEYGQQLLWVELLSRTPAPADGSLGDGSLGDGSLGDGSLGDGSLGEA